MFLFFKIFFYLFLPPQQHRPHRHHSPLTSHLPTSHQNHKSKHKQCPMTSSGLRYVLFFENFFLLISAISAASHTSPTSPPLSIHLPLPQRHIRNIKRAQTTSNNVAWAPSMFFFVFFFFLLSSATSTASPTSPPLSVDLPLPNITSET